MSLPLDVLETSVNQKVSILLKNGRILDGKLLGYDEHMNLVLDEVKEVKEGTKSQLGTIILRGSNIVSLSLH